MPTALLRRLVPFATTAALLLTLAPAAVHAADLTIAQAEVREVSHLNAQRAALGLVPVRIDSRLMAVARARSVDMATKHYFSHQQPDGKWAWDLMNDAGIRWFAAGEIIAWNTWGTLTESAAAASQQWHDSPGHYGIIKSPDYNYVGVGLAIDGSKKIWTAVFMKGPDRTGAWAAMKSMQVNTGIASATGTRSVTIAWRGADVRLSTLTAGLYTFQVQRRVNGGPWMLVWSATGYMSKTVSLSKGNRHEFRLRARDKAGNYGAWSAPLGIKV
jgi:uncharacterized protein YkwD